MTRRSFFNRIARAAAIVALAPQIAFRAPRLKFEESKMISFWQQTMRRTRFMDEEYLSYRDKFGAINREARKEDLRTSTW